MSSHELSSRYAEAEAIRMLQEYPDNDEADIEEDMPENVVQACESAFSIQGNRSKIPEINIFIRFNNKDCRSQRLVTDKFIHIRELMEALVSNFTEN